MLVKWQVFAAHKNYKNFSTFQFIIQHIIISCRLCLSPLPHTLSMSCLFSSKFPCLFHSISGFLCPTVAERNMSETFQNCNSANLSTKMLTVDHSLPRPTHCPAPLPVSHICNNFPTHSKCNFNSKFVLYKIYANIFILFPFLKYIFL